MYNISIYIYTHNLLISQHDLKLNNMETYKQIDYLSLLPKELKIALLFYLNPNELCNLSLMSHSWYKLINEELIWKNICFKCFVFNPKKKRRLTMNFYFRKRILKPFYKQKMFFV